MEFIYIFQAALIIGKFTDQNKISAMFVLFKKNRIYFNLKPKKKYAQISERSVTLLPS